MIESSLTIINPNLFGAYLMDLEELRALEHVIKTKELFRFHENTDTPSENECFEQELGIWLDKAHVCAVSSGTAGLRAALTVVGVQAKDRVAVSAFTFIASASAVLSLGAIPVPLELGPKLQIDIQDLSNKLGTVSAIIGVYVPGHSSNFIEAVALAHNAGVPVIEDACQALGVSCEGLPAGTIGDLGVYSFQQSKQLSAGEGGAVVSRNQDLIEKARRYTDHGACRLQNRKPTWEPQEAGFGENMRMSELQASVLRIQLKRLEKMILRQREIREIIYDIFKKVEAPVLTSVEPRGDAGSYLILLAPSEKIATEWQVCARNYGLLLRWLWRFPFFTLPPFKRAGLDRFNSCPRAISWASRLLALPIPPLSTDLELQTLIGAVNNFCKREFSL